MYIIRFILDLVFFRNPVTVLVLSFITLYLAILLNEYINKEVHQDLIAVKNGPPEIVRIEEVTEPQQTNKTGELNILAEIDLSDKFKFTIVTNGVETTKFIVPLYVATDPLTDNTSAKAFARAQEHADTQIRYDFNKKTEKRLIGAIVSENETVFKKAQKLSDSYGQIGPIVTVNGQPALFAAEHEQLAQDTLAKLGIEYGKYGRKPIYIAAFFGNRSTILQKQIKDNAISNPIYPIAYVLLAIAYIRSLWHVIAIARGSNDPSMVNALIRRFSGKPEQEQSETHVPTQSARQNKTKKPNEKTKSEHKEISESEQTEILAMTKPNTASHDLDPFSRLKPVSKPAPEPTQNPPAATVRKVSTQVFVRQFRKT